MTIFFIGDTHFGHKNIIKFDATKTHRPFASIEDHDEELIKRWNGVVKKGDIVWHLGDVAFGRAALAKVGRLNGIKKLVMGNHDHYPSAIYLNYFAKLYGVATIPGAILSHIPLSSLMIDRFGINIHGHTHAQSMWNPNYLCVSAEQVNLTPIALEELKL